MATDAHSNFGYATIATAPTPPSSGTTIVLQSGGGALMPATPFNATVWPSGVMPLASNAEIVRVTNVAADTLTISRAQEGTSAIAISSGYQFANSITKKAFTDIETSIPTSANPAASTGLTAVNGSATSFMRSDAAPALSQSIAPTWTGLHEFKQDALAATLVNSIKLKNTTASTAIAIAQNSPALGLEGNFWTGANTKHEYRMLVAYDAASGSKWSLNYYLGTVFQYEVLSSDAFGNLIVRNGLTVGGSLVIFQIEVQDSVIIYDASLNGVQFYKVDNGFTHTIRFDTDIDFTDSTVKFNGNCTLDDWFNQSVKTTAGPTFATIKTTPVAVASLPAAGTVGAGTRAFVNNALAPAFGATVAGGGAVNVPVYSDGTNWKVG